MKIGKIVSNSIYSIGVLMVIVLVSITLFGSNQPAFPEAMIPSTLKELAFIYLAIGTIPMLLACAAVYHFNNMKIRKQKKRLFALIFLPGFICAGCAIFIIGIIFLGFIINVPFTT